jgi:hypothetical protein
MTTKEILLLVLVLAMVAVIFCLNYFLGCPIHVLQKAVALNVVSLPHIAKFAAVVDGIHFLY